MKRIIYFIYFLYAANYRHIQASLERFDGFGEKAKQVLQMLFCSLKYGTSFIDYFNFQFYLKTKTERAAYATTGFMYDAHNFFNPKKDRYLIDDKSEFAKHFSRFAPPSFTLVERNTLSYEALSNWLCIHGIEKVAIKDPLGTTGSAVSFAKWDGIHKRFTQLGKQLSVAELVELYPAYSKVLFETFIEQHDVLKAVSPSALNTIRIITMVNNGVPEVIGSVFRISVNCEVDNFSAGNLAAEIEMQTGKVISEASYKLAATKPSCAKHPVTNEDILGLQIPHWALVMDLAKQAAMVFPHLRTVGWDMAIANERVSIIEGNTCWNKDTWQIPAGYGKKEQLNAHRI